MRKDKMVIKKQLSPYTQPVKKKEWVGWLSGQVRLIHRIDSLEKKSPNYPQIMQHLYTKGLCVCG